MTLMIVYCNLLNLSFPLNCEQFKGKGQSFKILIPPPTHLPRLELRVYTGKLENMIKVMFILQLRSFMILVTGIGSDVFDVSGYQ